jgi:ABC-type amino acid transport substrate-binding protein
MLLLLSNYTLAASDVPVLEWYLDHYPNRHSYPKNDPKPNANNAEPYGPTVDLMRELALRSGFVLKFSPDTPFARCLKLMASGKTDLMINLNFSKQRAAYMHLLPYRKGLPEVLFLNSAQKVISDFQQLQQATVALVRGYVYADSLLQQIKQQQLTVHEADSLDNAFGLLLRKRVDAVVAPQQQAAYLIASEPRYQRQFRVISLEPQLVTELFAHLGISKKSVYPQLVEAIRASLQQMVAEGRIDLLHREQPDPPLFGTSATVD